MPRTTYVKRAQQRYFTKPVIDPATGEQKQTPVMTRAGTQKVTKHGRPVFLRVTEDDKSRPKPNLKCEKCGTEIEVGMPYKHVTPKSGPYGGSKRVRCEACPAWQPWDLSNSLGARLAQISNDFSNAQPFESPEDVTSALEAAAESIREIASEKEEGASNIEEGFGHATYQSEELTATAESLNGWADEIEQVEVPDLPEPEERHFVRLNGDNVCDEEGYETESDAENARDEYLEEHKDLSEDDLEIEADTGDEPTEEQMDAWRDEVEGVISIVDESPV